MRTATLGLAGDRRRRDLVPHRAARGQARWGSRLAAPGTGSSPPTEAGDV